MRPRPMKPHVVALGLVVLKALCVVAVRIDRAGMVLPSMQSREGEKRTLIVALIPVFLSEKLRQKKSTKNAEDKGQQRTEMKVREVGRDRSFSCKKGRCRWRNRSEAQVWSELEIASGNLGWYHAGRPPRSGGMTRSGPKNGPAKDTLCDLMQEAKHACP